MRAAAAVAEVWDRDSASAAGSPAAVAEEPERAGPAVEAPARADQVEGAVALAAEVAVGLTPAVCGVRQGRAEGAVVAEAVAPALAVLAVAQAVLEDLEAAGLGPAVVPEDLEAAREDPEAAGLDLEAVAEAVAGSEVEAAQDTVSAPEVAAAVGCQEVLSGPVPLPANG